MLEYASAVREEQQDLSKITTGSTLKYSSIIIVLQK